MSPHDPHNVHAAQQPKDVFGRPLYLKRCCLHVRHKMMYVDPAQATPGMVDDRSDSRVYLCVLTQEVLGPDGKLVTPSNCSPGRGCYCGAARPEEPVRMPTPES
jgi:hypothetical protein